MTIQRDAGELLHYFYKEYLNDNKVEANKLIDETQWDGLRLDRAVRYLKDINAIKINYFLGNVKGLQNLSVDGLTPMGMQIVENKAQFKNTFGFWYS